jgi:hypothetical protein
MPTPKEYYFLSGIFNDENPYAFCRLPSALFSE